MVQTPFIFTWPEGQFDIDELDEGWSITIGGVTGLEESASWQIPFTLE